jgi:hypothetical protein
MNIHVAKEQYGSTIAAKITKNMSFDEEDEETIGQG